MRAQPPKAVEHMRGLGGDDWLAPARHWHGGRTLTLRLLASLMLILLIVSLCLAWLARNSLSQARERQLQEDRKHFANQMQALDRQWQLDAYAVRQQLELWLADTPSAKPDLRDARLRALLVTLLDQGSFVHAEIVDEQGQLLFSDGPSLPDGTAARQHSADALGWASSDEGRRVFRTVAGTLRYADRPSRLLLYVPMDHQLLSRLIFPDTELELRAHGQMLARTTQLRSPQLWPPQPRSSERQDGARRAPTRAEEQALAMLVLPWDERAGAPTLQIRHRVEAPITAQQLLVSGLISSGFFVVLGWLLLGRWMRLQTQRLHSLQQAASRFTEAAALTPELQSQLAETAATPDDIGQLADALRQLMVSIERARQSQAELNASLELRVTQRTEQLQAARDEALAAVQAKEHFLSNMSHEIRTPMNGMLGALELLSDTTLAPLQSQYIEVAATSGAALLDIINDVLDYAKIGAGQMPLVPEPMDLRAVAQSVTTLFSAAAQRKQLALQLSLDPGLQGWRLGDALRLRQVLMNLVGNAMKFTQRGHIRVLLSADAADPMLVDFEVSDTGIGIDPSQHGAIFEPFVQAEPSARRGDSGTGLGLAICRELVQAMGGALTVDSRLGEGARFRFKLALPPCPPEPSPEPLPGAAADTPAMPMAPAGSSAKGHERVRLSGVVLLVEDNPVNQLVGLAMLQGLGLTVLQAEHGEQALQILGQQAAPPAQTPREARVQLVLMDCQMPVMDGYEAVRRWRALEAAHRLPRLPIIAVTANALSDDVTRCLEAGMDGHLAKPFTQAGLAAALVPWLPQPPA